MGLFVNSLTADDKSCRHNRENFYIFEIYINSWTFLKKS